MIDGRKVFISGKITGVRNYKATFDRVAAELADDDYIVLNPATLPKGLSYADYARICTAMLEAADTVLFLPGYENSPGATMEMQYAKYIGKAVAFYPDDVKTPNGCKRPNWDHLDANW